MDIHPAANIFPMMEAAELQQLADDIRANGLREWVVVYQGQVLDGRNRIKACEIAGVEPEVCEIEDEIDPVTYVLSKNLHRRHLNTSQRSLVSGRIKKYHAALAKERQKRKPKSVVENLPPQEKAKARDTAAAVVNVSGKSVDHAVTVLEKGSPELIQAVEAGKVSVSKAAAVAKATPKPQQLAAVSATKPKPAEKTPLERLQQLWTKADDSTRATFRAWIDT